ncbi:forkhead box protein I2-A-like [Tropilaelaps mercedesae]|uniref:Forkhead box protein I2-A-like n=1 Tax=Tropilaelaps mercedesae TaxID=418985 RepID=A0A1V9X7R1_9ACAR|nr:forkhead box protein I2-A-like [Tropilaelaps mercedesae]
MSSSPQPADLSGIPSMTDCHLRLMEYAQRLLQQHQQNVVNQSPMSLLGPMPFGPQIEVPSPLLGHPFQSLNRFLLQEDPKPQHSYIGLIAMAILSSPEKKMVLSDIYQYILDNYPYFRNRGPGWRNSIRHNLSLNDCFVKAGRSANGKGHYWAVHPANIEDFTRGDFRRRRAQRKVRKHMGLSVPDEDDSPCASPVPPPATMAAALSPFTLCQPFPPPVLPARRTFDVESLLAPEPKPSFPGRPMWSPLLASVASAATANLQTPKIEIAQLEDPSAAVLLEPRIDD